VLTPNKIKARKEGIEMSSELKTIKDWLLYVFVMLIGYLIGMVLGFYYLSY